jgi:hypothetical protein
MKTEIRSVLSRKVHPLLFVLACLLLIAIASGATIMANHVLSEADFVLHQMTLPLRPGA